jgi:hypothetical protein
MGGRRMNRAVISAYVWGIYNGALGLFLLLAPGAFCALFGLAAPTDFWSRWAGGLLLAICFLYFRGAMQDVRPLFRFTVEGRPAVLVVAIVLVAAHLTQWPMIGFGVVECLGAAWMAWALRQPAMA